MDVERVQAMSSYENHAEVHHQTGVQNIGRDINHRTININLNADSRPGDRGPGTSLDSSILKSLAFPAMNNRKSMVESPYHQTCQWIFELPEYMNWKAEPSSLLWIKGKPGTGKSTLMSYIYDSVYYQERSATDTDIYLQFFFHARGVPLQRSYLGMMRSLAYQMFYHDFDVRGQLRKFYGERYGSLDESWWEWQAPELQRLLTNMVLSSAQHRQIVILVDALDEAGDTGAEIACYFHDLLRNIQEHQGKLKICISSRHYPVPPTCGSYEVHVEKNNRDNIASYIRGHVEDSWQGKHKSLIGLDIKKEWQEFLDKLNIMANGVFQWARLVMPLLSKRIRDGCSPSELRQWLPETSVSLDDVYGFIFEKVIDPSYKIQTQRLFQWMHTTSCPLTVQELYHAVMVHTKTIKAPSVPTDSMDFIVYNTDDEILRRLQSWSGGLVEVTRLRVVRSIGDNPFCPVVQVVHQSVNDFLSRSGFARLYYYTKSYGQLDLPEHHSVSVQIPSLIETYHSEIYWICLNYLLSVAQETSRLQSQYYLGTATPKELRNKVTVQFPLAEYAALFLLDHAKKAGRCRSQDFEEEVQKLARTETVWTFLLSLYNRSANEFGAGLPDEVGATSLHFAAAADATDLALYMIKHDADLTFKDSRGRTSLSIATERGHFDTVRVLVEAGADIHAELTYDGDALTLAAGRNHTAIFSWLLQNGADVDKVTKTGYTALYRAAQRGNTAIVKLCIAAGAKLDSPEWDRCGQPLQVAAARGNLETVQLLLNGGANVNASGGAFDSALTAAVSEGKCTELVQSLLEAGADVNAQGNRKETALYAAAGVNNAETIRLLLKAGANVNAQGGIYGNALQHSATTGHMEIAKLLLQAGADVNAQGGQFGNALQAATCRGMVEMVRLLLQAGANPNAHEGQYGSALQVASAGNEGEIVQLLLDAGADVNIQGGKYGCALGAAAAHSATLPVVRLLLDAGADPNSRGAKNCTALQAASRRGELETVQLLLDAGADVNIQGGEHGNALQAAAGSEFDHTHRVRLLLDAGADVNARGGLHGNALQAALATGQSENVQLLLDAGADVNARGGYYGCPLQAAIARPHRLEMIELLLSKGADPNIQGGRFGNALQAASLRHDLRIVQLLLDAGADVNAEGGEHGTALQAAASDRWSSPDVLRLLLHAGADVNAEPQRFFSALQAAKEAGRMDFVQILIEARARAPVKSRKRKRASTPTTAKDSETRAPQSIVR